MTVETNEDQFVEKLRIGRTRRRQLFAFLFLAWIPLFAVYAILSLFLPEKLISLAYVAAGGMGMVIMTIRCMSWPCPRCHKAFFSPKGFGFSSGAFTDKCHSCGLPLKATPSTDCT